MLKERIAKVENQTSVLDRWKEEIDELCEQVSRIDTDTCALRSRLDEADDRARRDNLLFYNIPDTKTETAIESEEKILHVLNNTLKLNVSGEDISRAHRIGHFNPAKQRPLIVKFANYKTRELVFSKKSELNNSDINLSQDFCPATRQARKKLVGIWKAAEGTIQTSTQQAGCQRQALCLQCR